MKYVCNICGYVYDEESEGVKFSDLPSDWTCPICGAAKSDFTQLQAKEQAIFLEFANYYDSITPTSLESEVADILALLNNDLDPNFPALTSIVTVEKDHGAFRAKVWGLKGMRKKQRHFLKIQACGSAQYVNLSS